jgi:hypothetical protein
LPGTQFWLLHVLLIAVAGAVFLIAGKLFGHLLSPGDEGSAAASGAR